VKKYLVSDDLAWALIDAMRMVCGLQPTLVLYGLGEGDEVPASTAIAHGPGYGYVIAEGQYQQADWTGVGGPRARSQDSGAWVLVSVATGEVAYARIIDDDGICQIQGLVEQSDVHTPDGYAFAMPNRTVGSVGVGLVVSSLIEVRQSESE